MSKKMVIYGKGGFVMNGTTYERGSITISDNFLHIYGTALNLNNIDNIDTVVFDRYSYVKNLGTWLFGLVIATIVCSIFKNLDWLFSIYLLSLVVLIAHNIYQHQKRYYGLKIQTNARKTIFIKSDCEKFIMDIHKTILKASNSKKASYTINLDSHDIINNGIISKGNNNKNKVVRNKNNDSK